MSNDIWYFDDRVGKLELEREFDTDLLTLRIAHRPRNVSLSHGLGVRLNRTEAREIGERLLAYARDAR